MDDFPHKLDNISKLFMQLKTCHYKRLEYKEQRMKMRLMELYLFGVHYEHVKLNSHM